MYWVGECVILSGNTGEGTGLYNRTSDAHSLPSSRKLEHSTELSFLLILKIT